MKLKSTGMLAYIPSIRTHRVSPFISSNPRFNPGAELGQYPDAPVSGEEYAIDAKRIAYAAGCFVSQAPGAVPPVRYRKHRRFDPIGAFLDGSYSSADLWTAPSDKTPNNPETGNVQAPTSRPLVPDFLHADECMYDGGGWPVLPTMEDFCSPEADHTSPGV